MIRKTIYLGLLMLSPMVFHAQKGLTGVWSGKISNDSNTIRRDQSFEIALTQYREKVYGYSRTSFIVNDTLFTVLKRVKGKVEGDICEIKDDEIISYNFPGKIDKGVKVTTTFRMNKQDSSWHLDGKWSTNKTKHYYSITGTVQLKEETDPLNSKIFAHLQELKVDKEIELLQLAANKPANTSQAETKLPGTTSGEDKQTVSNQSGNKNADRETASDRESEKRTAGKQPVDSKAVVTKAADTKEGVNQPVANNHVINNHVINKPAESKPAATGKPASSNSEMVSAPKASLMPAGPLPAAFGVNDRINIMSQEVLFTSDSLQLSLYDNGEVDGDTVSVLLNSEIILSRQMLKASAMRTTIQTPPGKSEFLLVLYAENLGKYPPNTGLLIVKDGEQTHQVRFSADLKQNAAIIFRRRQ